MACHDPAGVAERIVAAARRCVGIRYRAQGRGAEGMDCLGVVLYALSAAGKMIGAPSDYAAVGHSSNIIECSLIRGGLSRHSFEDHGPGDILLVHHVGRWSHFAVATEHGLIEAHAGVRRVVERSLAVEERWGSAWRFAG